MGYMRFNKLDMNLLAALDVLLRTRSVTRAADEMFITQSAMSNALGRLRQFFDDPLLVQVGRTMEISPLAATLQAPVRDIMMRVESATQIRPHFDPMKAVRTFDIVISDYSLAVLGAELSRKIAGAAPHIQLNLRPQNAKPNKLLEQAETDLLIVPDYLGTEDQGNMTLFEDELVVLVADDGPYADGPLTLEQFAQAPHILMEPLTGQESYSAVAMRNAGINPPKMLSSYLFSAIPDLIRGTDRIALLQKRLADPAAALGGLRVKSSPMHFPPLRQTVRWQTHRSRDPGLMWLRDQNVAAARASDPDDSGGSQD